MSRWVELAGIDNVRDLGGLPVAGNRRTRFGLALRSSTPQELTESDRDLLIGGMGLRTVIDLRLPAEARREGHGLLAGSEVRVVGTPFNGARVGRDARVVREAMVPDARRHDLVEHYLAMLASSVPSIVTAVRIIADGRQHAVLFHCAAGKDRTGILAAVLLHAVGVPTEAIAADYALSWQRISQIQQRLSRLASYRDLPAVADAVLEDPPEVMHRFIEALEADFEGGAGWLLRNGLTEDELDQLCSVLVEPADPTPAVAPALNRLVVD